MTTFLKGASGENAAYRVSRRDLNVDQFDPDAGIWRFRVAAESWRFIAYCGFWVMAMIAVTITKVYVVPSLAAGSPSGDFCGPFDREEYPNGFDFYTESHIVDAGGYANICSYWDYSPSREIAGMVYPIFEYAMLIYLILDFLTIGISYKRGFVSNAYWMLAKVFFPIELILTSWFRMIFIFIAYEDVSNHTLSFLGLQLAFIMITIQNGIHIIDTGVSYKFLGGPRGTKIFTRCYVVANIVISIIKVYLSSQVITYGRPVAWSLKEVAFGWNWSRFIDSIWLFFNGLAPMLIAFIRARSEKPLIIEVSMETPNFIEIHEGVRPKESKPAGVDKEVNLDDGLPLEASAAKQKDEFYDEFSC